MTYIHSLLKLSESQSLSQKINSIQGAIEYLEKIHAQTMGEVTSQSWSSIIAIFSALGSAACLPSLPPVLGFGLVGGAVASMIASVCTAAQAYPGTKLKDEKVALFLGVLKTNTPQQWAHLLEECESAYAFLSGIERAAANGYIDTCGNFQYYGDNTRHPFDVAREWAIASSTAESAIASIGVDEAQGQAETPTIGQHTKLTAVEVPALPEPEKTDSDQHEAGGEANRVPQSAVPVDQAGIEILDALALSRRSTLLIGDTGAGKSVTQAYILTKLFDLHPNADVQVLTQKADSFCGLQSCGRVTLFDSTYPEQALLLIGRIWSIYDKRRRLPESERPGLPPVRLILADWLSINQALDDLKNEEPVKSSKYLTKLADIIYNGRELNVCLLVDLQSYNLAAVGLKADRNSRKNFNLIGLGNYSVDELGMVNESYGVLTNLIGDRYIVSDEQERANLGAAFKQLQPISKAHQRPIIFSGLSPARLALLPDLRAYKSNLITVTNSSGAPPISEASLPTDKQAWDRLILESDNDQINELIEQHRSKPSEPEPQTIDEQISFVVEAIAEYFQEKNLESDTPRNIYNGKSRLRKLFPKFSDFKDALELAAELGEIVCFNEGNSTRVSLI